MRRALEILLVGAVVGLAGCGGGGGGGGEASTATLQASLGNDFGGMSVRVRGTRATPAVGTYSCLSEFDVCLPLAPSGVTQPIADLCPTVDTPVADWSFTYTLYVGKHCVSELANASCASQPATALARGDNVSAVECQTRNDQQTVDLCMVDPMTGAGRENCPEELRRILVLEPTVASVFGSDVATLRAIKELGFIPVLKSAGEWAAMTAADFTGYRAIVLADPMSGEDCQSTPAAFEAAETTAETWGPVVTGNALVIGTDPTVHAHADSGNPQGAYKLIKDGIRFATWKPYQTGLYMALGCAYVNATADAPARVSALSHFGTFWVKGTMGREARIVGRAEALSDLTDDDLFDWSVSVHQLFVGIEGTDEFQPFALGILHDSPTDLPYILARGLE